MKKRNWKERICALTLAVLLPLTNMLPGMTMVATAAGDDATTNSEVQLYVYEEYTDANGVKQKAAINDADIKFYDANGDEITSGSITVTPAEDKPGQYTVEGLTEDKTYSYEVIKTGYVKSDEKISWDWSKTKDQAGNPIPVEVAMVMDEISIENNPGIEFNITEQSGSEKVLIQNKITNVEGIDYSFESSNTDVATVDESGTVTAVKPGTATITIKRQDKVATCNVKVTSQLKAMSLSVTSDPETKIDVNKITFSVTGIPLDATGTINLYKDTQKLTKTEISIAESASYEYTVTDEDDLKGNVQFKAEYVPAENECYLTTTAVTDSIAYKKTIADVVVKVDGLDASNSIKTTYGMPITFTVTKTNGDDRNVMLTYDQEVVTINHDETTGEYTITPLKATDTNGVTVSIQAKESENYVAGTEREFTLVVNKKSVDVDYQSIAWSPMQTEKVYDGKAEVDVSGVISIPSSSDTVDVTATATISTDAGNYTSCTIKNISIESDKYDIAVTGEDKTVTFANGADGKTQSITITKRPLYVQVARNEQTGHEYSAEYTAKDLGQAVTDTVKAALVNGTGSLNNGGEDGLVTGDSISLEQYAQTTLEGNGPWYVGSYEDVIKVTLLNNQLTNYELKVMEDKNYTGRLKITPEVTDDTAIKGRVAASGDGVYNNSGDSTVWVRGDSKGQLEFSLKDDTDYNTIMVAKDTDYVEFPQEGAVLTFSDTESIEHTLKMYLVNSDDTNTTDGITKTIANSDGDANGYTVHVDAGLPKAVFEGSGSGLLSPDIYAQFKQQSNTAFEIKITASDADSGVNSFETKIVSVPKTATNADIKTTIEKTGEWTARTVGETAIIAVPTDNTEGNYVVAAKIRDNVGNEAIYTSSGLIFETNLPTATVTVNEGKEIGKVAATAKIPFEIQICDDLNADNAAVISSGIASVQVSVTDGDSSVLGGYDVDNKLGTDSFELSPDVIDKISGAVSQVKDSLAYYNAKSAFTVEGQLSVNKYHTENAKIIVTVTDNAGNVYTTQPTVVKLDNEKPEVTVSYSSTSEVKNDYYFAAGRTMNISYKERNFDVSGLSFEVFVDGDALTNAEGMTLLSYDELSSMGAKYGITAGALADSESSIEKDNWTDDRAIDFAITFEKDGAYKIIPHITDMSGNKNEDESGVVIVAYKDSNSKANEQFIIDTKSPSVAVTYNPAVGMNDTYFTSREMTITFTERNFKEGLLTFELEVDGVKQEGLAADKNLTLADLKALPKTMGIQISESTDSESANSKIASHTDGRTVTYTVSFMNDGHYKLIPHITDLAGRINEGVVYADSTSPANETFYVDNTNPTIQVTYNDGDIGVSNDKYFNKQRTMKIVYTERNFDESNLMFNVSVDGVAYENITYKELCELAEIESNDINLTMTDSEIGASEYTNARTHILELVFGKDGKDHDYQITTWCRDLSGNQSEKIEDAESTLVATGGAFTVDMVAPVMSVTYYSVNPSRDVTSTIGTEVQDSMYHNCAVEAVVTIEERNFSAADVGVQETAEDINRETVQVKDQVESAQTSDEWAAVSPDVYSQTFAFAEDANYTFNMSYTDQAGNKAVLSGTTDEPKDYYFTVDTKAPTGEIQISDEKEIKTFHDLLERVFGFFLNKKSENYITTSGEEATSPVKVSYYKYYPGRDVNGTIEALSEEKLKSDEITWTPITGTEDSGYYTSERSQSSETAYLFETSYGVENPEQFIIYEKIEDKAGHVAYLNADGIICEDKAAAIKVTIDTKAPETSFDVAAEDVVYNTDVEVTIEVTDTAVQDANGRDVYSGLKEVYYEIRNNGSVTQFGNYNDELNDPAARVESLTKQVVINSALNNSNNVQIYVKAEDNSGNTAEYITDSIQIDITAPTIDVTYNLNSDVVKNGKYFNADRTMTITYTERNINENGLTFDFKAGGTDYGTLTLKELEEKAGEFGLVISGGVGSDSDLQANYDVTVRSDERTVTYTIQFTGGAVGDMDYEIVPHIEDQASNTNANTNAENDPESPDIHYFVEGMENVEEPTVTVAAPQVFTIDKLQPTMDIKYYLVDTDADGNETLEEIPVSTDEINRLYKNKTIRAVVAIDERNFSLSNAEGKIFTAEYAQVVPGFSWIQHDGTDGDVTTYENAAMTAGNWGTTSEDGIVKWTQSFDFVADGDYSFALAYTDLAGNTTADYEPHYYTVDKTAPTIDVVYKTENGEVVTPGTLDSDRLYYSGKKITATVTIDERNFPAENAVGFEDGQMLLVYNAADVNAEEGEIVPDYSEAANTRGNWTDQPNDEGQYLRVQEFEFMVDANYTLALTYQDQAGNKCVYDPRYFTVDDTIPTGEITVTAQKQIYDRGAQEPKWSWDVFNPDLYFGIFDTDKVTVAWTTDDMTAGVDAVGYYKYTPPTEARNEFQWLSYEQMSTLSDETDWIWTTDTQIVLDDEQQAIIYLKIVDRAGNVRYVNTKEGIVIDETEPVAPQITITTTEPAQGIYSGNVDYRIDVIDPVSGGTYSGLYDVHYEVTNNGEVTQSGSYEEELSDPKARKQSISKTEQVNAQLNNSNHVTITVYATDYAGNTTTASKDLAIDITAPQVWITYDLYNGLNERYYNAVRTATVHVKERNFDINAVDFTITNTDGTMPDISGWNISALAGESDEAENTCTVVFAADGDYTIAMNCTDKAGNKSAAYQIQPDDDFTIDRTVPTISVTYDNNNAANGMYYNAPRTATITVNEHNFNGSEVQTAIAAALQAQGITPPPVNGWTSHGDIHTATVYFSADGDYSFTINYSDLAGNAAEEFVQSQFTLDQTKPTIEIFDIVDKSANNGVVAPGVNYSDVNYTPAGVNITIRGAQHASAGLDGTRTAIANGESIKMADFAYEESVDDVYILTAQVTDLAGNVEEQSVTFSVNRFGSNFIFSDETAEYLDKYYSNQEQNLVVTEINVDTLEHRGITYGLDGELVTLEEDKDYTVRESGTEVSWKSYQYTIKAENFEKEGMYNVTIDSVDRATNEVNNKIKDANIEFVIDKTKPTVVITGIENDGQYRTDVRDITIAVEDNVAMGSVDLYVDDETHAAASYDGEDIRDQKGRLPYSLKNASDWQYLKAVAVDAAGNEADTEQIRVLVTANMLVQFYRNTPLVIGSIIALLAIAAGIWFLIIKRKKDDEEKENG